MNTFTRKLFTTRDTDLYDIKTWKCATFEKTLLYGFIPLTIPLIAGFFFFRVWLMGGAVLVLCLSFVLSFYAVKHNRLTLSVNMCALSSICVNLLYLIQHKNSDGLYFSVFIIIITGIFLGSRSAFFYALLVTLGLVLLARVNEHYAVFPRFNTYFGQNGIVLDSRKYFSTIIFLCIVGAIISILFQNFFTDLVQKVRAYHHEKSMLRSELAEAQKLESIGIIASDTAHDLGKAITSIKSCANLILKKFPHVHDDLTKYATNINTTCTGIGEYSEKLLSIAGSHRTDPQKIDLHQVISNIATLLRDIFPDNITVETVFNSRSSIVAGNLPQLQTVLMNCAYNARDAMEGGGNLTVKTEDVERTPVKDGKSNIAEKAACISIAISDTGKGMDEQTRTRIFNRFFTTKGPEKGNGLGLSIVERIVTSHKGEIHVSSAPGKGTQFTIVLPLVEAHNRV